MAKDVNIHVKTTGTQQTTTELNQVAHATEEMGAKTSRATGWIAEGLKSLIGPLGFAAIATAAASAAGKIAQFFDNVKTRCDEAVNRLQDVRRGFQEIFEAMNAFDEKSRKQITKDTVSLLRDTAVSQQVGLPVINAYTRQFRGAVESGKITEEQYNRGLKDMLGYAQRHGSAEGTSDLISIMAGWGMNTPEQQGKFRREIGAVSGKSGLTGEEVITALGRSAPTVKAMGWTPELALENIGIIAANEIGKKKLTLPATTIESFVNPQVKDIDKTYGISKEAMSDPSKLFGEVTRLASQKSQKDTMAMLTDIYGAEPASGVYKLITGQRKEMAFAISQAGSPAAVEAEKKEEKKSVGTLERQQAKTGAVKLLNDLDVTGEETIKGQIRDIGNSARDRYRRKSPKEQWLRELLIVGDEAEKEDAAYREWRESLSENEVNRTREEWIKNSTESDVKLRPEAYKNTESPFVEAWGKMRPRQRLDALQRNPETTPGIPSADANNITNNTTNNTTTNFHYHNEIIYQLGNKSEIGPRFGRDDK
jgi:hypothetical protein